MTLEESKQLLKHNLKHGSIMEIKEAISIYKQQLLLQEEQSPYNLALKIFDVTSEN